MKTQDEIFDQILRNNLKIEVSEKFTENIMAKISILAEKRRKKEVYKEKIMLFLPFCIVLILISIVIALSNNVGQTSLYAQYSKNFMEILNTIIYSRSIMTIVAIVSSISILLAIDLKLRIKNASI